MLTLTFRPQAGFGRRGPVARDSAGVARSAGRLGHSSLGRSAVPEPLNPSEGARNGTSRIVLGMRIERHSCANCKVSEPVWEGRPSWPPASHRARLGHT